MTLTKSKRPSVYIETTIPSYYFETRTSDWVQTWREATRTWWDKSRSAYRLVTSEYSAAELELAPPKKRTAAIEMLREVPFLAVTDEVRELSERYIADLVMPRDAKGDAGHLAMATVYGIDFLLTWNCRHLANAN